MINPGTLKKGDIVVFGGKVEVKIRGVSKYSVNTEPYSSNSDYDVLDTLSPLWEIAELKKPSLPRFLHHYELNPLGCYSLWQDVGNYKAPSKVLSLLKRDVLMLEAAGVKETE